MLYGSRWEVYGSQHPLKIARKVFVNLYLDDQKRLTYLCKEPFDSVVSMSENLTGGGSWA